VANIAVTKGAEGTERVGSRAARLSDDKHLDRPQLPHLDVEVEALVDAGGGILNMLADLGIGQAGDMNCAYLGQIHRTGAIDRDLGVEIDLPPHPDHQLIARSKDVVWRDVHFAERGKGRGHLAKKRIAIHGQQSADGSSYQQLEFGRGARALERQLPGLIKGSLLRLGSIQATLVGEAGNTVEAAILQAGVLLRQLSLVETGSVVARGEALGHSLLIEAEVI
jgi:hypothetical protein